MLPLLLWFQSGMLERLALPRNVAKADWREQEATQFVERAQLKIRHALHTPNADEQLVYLADAANLLMMAAGVLARGTERIDL
jgi:hypothetical protein